MFTKLLCPLGLPCSAWSPGPEDWIAGVVPMVAGSTSQSGQEFPSTSPPAASTLPTGLLATCLLVTGNNSENQSEERQLRMRQGQLRCLGTGGYEVTGQGTPGKPWLAAPTLAAGSSSCPPQGVDVGSDGDDSLTNPFLLLPAGWAVPIPPTTGLKATTVSLQGLLLQEADQRQP